MKQIRGSLAAALAFGVTCLVCPAFADTHAHEVGELDQKLADAKAVYQELLSTPDRGVPEALLKETKCIAVIPHAIKGALGYGARFGTGVMSCRNAQGEWSPPTFLRLTGGSIGLQIGGESSDLVL